MLQAESAMDQMQMQMQMHMHTVGVHNYLFLLQMHPL